MPESIAALKLSRGVRKRLDEAGLTTIDELEASLNSQQFDKIVPRCSPNTKCRNEIEAALKSYMPPRAEAEQPIDTRYFVVGCVLLGITIVLLAIVPVVEVFGWPVRLGPWGAGSMLYLSSLSAGFAAGIFQGRFRLVQRIPGLGSISSYVPEIAIDATAGCALFLLMFLNSPFRYDTNAQITYLPNSEIEGVVAENEGATTRVDWINSLDDSERNRVKSVADVLLTMENHWDLLDKNSNTDAWFRVFKSEPFKQEPRDFNVVTNSPNLHAALRDPAVTNGGRGGKIVRAFRISKNQAATLQDTPNDATGTIRVQVNGASEGDYLIIAVLAWADASSVEFRNATLNFIIDSN